MPDPKQLPFLLQLLDDESPVVRDAVIAALAAFGPDLETALAELSAPPDAVQREAMRALFCDPENNRQARRTWLRKAWPSWYALAGDMEKLETALTLIAEFQTPLTFPPAGESVSVRAGLDALAEEVRTQEDFAGPVGLARFLFEHKGFKGARTDFHNPKNSSLAYVLEQKQGIPISLASLYMLVGWRLGLAIHACNWPGHFLTRVQVDGTWMLVDCYNEGHSLDEVSFLKMQGPSREAAQLMIDDPPTVEMVIARVLHNLVRAYRQNEEWHNAEFFVELLKDMKQK